MDFMFPYWLVCNILACIGEDIDKNLSIHKHGCVPVYTITYICNLTVFGTMYLSIVAWRYFIQDVNLMPLEFDQGSNFRILLYNYY